MNKLVIFLLLISMIYNLEPSKFSCKKKFGVCCTQLEPKFCKCRKTKGDCPIFFPPCTEKNKKRVVEKNEISLDIMCS